MPIARVLSIGGLNTKINPLNLKDGDMLQCVNMENDLFGAKKRRGGLGTVLNNPDSSDVDQLFTWSLQTDNWEAGTPNFYTYRLSGNVVYYSTNGTANWLPMGDGTVTGGTVGVAIAYREANLDTTLLVGDGVRTGLQSTTGTSFGSVGGSIPIGRYLETYANHTYIGGTASQVFQSTGGTPTEFNAAQGASGFNLDGGGKINGIFKTNDRLVITKSDGNMLRYDGFNTADFSSSSLSPASPRSIAEIEGYKFWANRFGVFGYGGDRPELLSLPVEKLLFNGEYGGIAGTALAAATGEVFKYKYLLSVGQSASGRNFDPIDNAILRYDIQLNDWGVWSTPRKITAMLTYRDINGADQLLLGDEDGKNYTYQEDKYTDNGSPIYSVMEFVITGGIPETEKKWSYLWLHTNPGCLARVQIAYADAFTLGTKKWYDLGNCTDGFSEFRLPDGAQSRLLFVKITDQSITSRFNFYGFSYSADPRVRQ